MLCVCVILEQNSHSTRKVRKLGCHAGPHNFQDKIVVKPWTEVKAGFGFRFELGSGVRARG